MDNISLFPPNLKVSDIVTMETIVQSIGTQLTGQNMAHDPNAPCLAPLVAF